MPDAMREKALQYMYRRIRKARQSIAIAERKGNSDQEIENLLKKIEMFEWIAYTICKEGAKDG